MKIVIAMTAALTLGLLTGCSGRGRADEDIAVPRRHGFHRLQLPEASYRPDTIGGVALEINREVTAEHSADGWLTLTYPGIGASVYLTYTPLPADGDATAISNRIERLSMNTGGAHTSVSELTTAAGSECIVMVTAEGSPTPVQFIAVRPRQWMISGSAHVEALPTAPLDSLRPVVDVMLRDINHLVSRL